MQYLQNISIKYDKLVNKIFISEKILFKLKNYLIQSNNNNQVYLRQKMSGFFDYFWINPYQQQQIQHANRQNMVSIIKFMMINIQFQPLPSLISQKYIFAPNHKKQFNSYSYPQCTFSILWQYTFHSLQQKLSLQLTVFHLKLRNEQIKISQYKTILNQWAIYINKQNNLNLKVSFYFHQQTQQYQFKIFFYTTQQQLKRNTQFVFSKWKLIKKYVIQSIFRNIFYQNSFNEESIQRLKSFRQQFQIYKTFQRQRRKSKINKKEKIKINTKNYLTQTTKINNVLESSQVILGKKIKVEKIKYSCQDIIKKLVKKILLCQQDVQNSKKHVKYSIYHAVLGLIQKGSSTYIKPLKKHQSHAICQGIQIIKEITQYRHRINRLSQLWLKQIIFRYELTVHANKQSNSMNSVTNLQNKVQHNQIITNYKNIEQLIKIQQSKQTVLYEQMILAVKGCLNKQLSRQRLIQYDNKIKESQQPKDKQFQFINKNNLKQQKQNKIIQQSQKSFKNEYNFLEFIRDNVFPYIAKYYLQVSTKAKLQTQISKKFIYVQFYSNRLQQSIDNDDKFEKISLQKLIDILFQITATLRFLDRHQILHRDIKPTNIFLDQHYNVKLIDWGSCCTRQNFKCSIQIDRDDEDVQQQSSINSNSSQNNEVQNTKKNKKLFVQSQQKLQTTQHWSQQSKDFLIDKDSEPSIFKVEFNNNVQKFNRNYYFDVYSFGKIVGFIIEKLKTRYHKLDNEQFWLIKHLQYLYEKCVEKNPYDRLGPLQIMLYLSELIKIIKEKKRIIRKTEYSQKSQRR